MSREATSTDTWGGRRTDRIAGVCVPVLAVLMGSSPAYAQNWRITPSISVTETLTDNVALAPADRKRSDLITQVSPGIRVDGSSGRAKLNLDYRVTELLYARESGSNSTQNFLNASGMLEAVENWLFVDARGSITQQSISAFGTQPLADGNVNRNRAETSTYQLSPYIRGRLGSVADYDLRYRWTTTSARGNALADIQTEEAIGRLSGSTAFAALGWMLDASHQTVNYDAARDTELTRLNGRVIYRFDPQFRVSAAGGWETNNYTGVNKQETTNYGGGFDWAPTDRTQVSAFKEKRFFGNGHTFSLNHRTPLTAWQLSDTKDVTVVPTQLAGAGAGTAFDLLFNALASRIPDPVARAQEVERLLRQGGIPADLAEARGFLTTRTTVTRSQRASVGILGVRNTVTLAINLTEQQSLGVGAGVADNFTLSPTIQTRGVSADWSHRLSGLSTLNVFANQSHSSGTGAGAGLDSTQTMLRLLLSHQVGPKVFATVGARSVRFDTTAGSGYREKALTASLSMTF